MPRMSKKHQKELAFFLNDSNRMTHERTVSQVCSWVQTEFSDLYSGMPTLSLQTLYGRPPPWARRWLCHFPGER